MSTLAAFRVPARDFALAAAFERCPRLIVTAESSITKSVPSMWIGGADATAIDEALSVDPSVDAADLLIESPDRFLYDVTLAEHSRRVIDRLLEDGGSILEVSGSAGWWQIELRFAERTSLSRTHDRLTEEGTHVEVARVSRVTAEAATHPRLTPEQREALTAAFEHGYFEIPRRTSMEELADVLGISHQALSERLRRAYETLVDAELQPAGRPPTEP